MTAVQRGLRRAPLPARAARGPERGGHRHRGGAGDARDRGGVLVAGDTAVIVGTTKSSLGIVTGVGHSSACCEAGRDTAKGWRWVLKSNGYDMSANEEEAFMGGWYSACQGRCR